ncbi:MAG: hypothetical protein GX142_00915 [Chloroflexi bacterium]|nr:hypothetical protein [Chloroflexota bacterium]
MYKKNDHPMTDAELEGLLAELSQVPQRNPDNAARTKARYLIAVGKSLQASTTEQTIKTRRKKEFREMKPFFKKFSLAFTLAAVLLVFLLGGLGVTAAAASSALPGDPLYGVKTGWEQTRLQLTRQDFKKVELNLAYAQNRLDEIETLIAAERLGDLEASVQAYETYILEALAGLEAIRSNSMAVDSQLDRAITASLGKYTADLETLSNRVQTQRRTRFDEAILFSKSAGAYHGKIEFVGTVNAINPDLWVVSGLEVIITASTEIEMGIDVGQQVEVEGWVDALGSIYAREIEHEADGRAFSLNGKGEFLGIVNEIQPDYWVVNGIRFEVSATARIEPGIRVGDFVEVEFVRNDKDEYILREAEFAFDDDEYVGSVDEIHTEYWVIDGLRFELLPKSRIEKGIKVGDFVEVEFVRNASGENYLLEVEFADSEIYGVADEINTDHWIVNGIRCEVLPNTKSEPGIKVGDYVEVEFVRNQAGEYILLDVEHEDAYNSSDAGYGHHRHGGDDDEMVGFVDEIHSDYWVINGIRFNLLPKSEIEWGLKVGDFVEVEFFKNSAGAYFLLEVEHEDD